MPKISIVALISGFFVFALVLINIALYLEHNRQIRDQQYFALQRFEVAMRLMHDDPKEFADKETKLNIKISKYSKSFFKDRGKKILGNPFADMILYKNMLFLVPKPPPDDMDEKFLHKFPTNIGHEPPVLQDMEPYSTNRLFLLIALINILMLSFFWIVLRKLLNLKNLKMAIMKSDEGERFRPIELSSRDELGDIANEFNLAMEKIHLLKEARTFFLRNILHELKTPIMKGKIVSNSLEESMKRAQLQQAFIRLESLLSEMVKVEKLNSNEWKLDKKEYRLVDIIDHSIDLLMSDTSRIKILGIADAPIVNVDFELFSTVFKNLLDNALKYSSEEVYIYISPMKVEICSFGNELDKKRLDFSKPFNRETEGSTSGLGLGLYIVNEILKKHDLELYYTYKYHQNRFIFTLKN